MAHPDKRYGPSRRRGRAGWLLDWAAGVLLANVLLALAAGVLVLLISDDLARLGALTIAAFIAWPLGSALGVWLSVGRPFAARSFAWGYAAALVGAGIAMTPYWIAVESDLLRGAGALLAVVAAPALARAGVMRARAA